MNRRVENPCVTYRYLRKAPNGVLSGHRTEAGACMCRRSTCRRSLTRPNCFCGRPKPVTYADAVSARHAYTFHQFIIQRRVELGRTLLLHSSLSIADITQTADFAHQSHMARHMRRILNVTPGDLRSIPQRFQLLNQNVLWLVRSCAKNAPIYPYCGDDKKRPAYRGIYSTAAGTLEEMRMEVFQNKTRQVGVVSREGAVS